MSKISLNCREERKQLLSMRKERIGWKFGIRSFELSLKGKVSKKYKRQFTSFSPKEDSPYSKVAYYSDKSQFKLLTTPKKQNGTNIFKLYKRSKNKEEELTVHDIRDESPAFDFFKDGLSRKKIEKLQMTACECRVFYS